MKLEDALREYEKTGARDQICCTDEVSFREYQNLATSAEFRIHKLCHFDREGPGV